MHSDSKMHKSLFFMSNISLSLTWKSYGPVANAYIQRAWLVQVEVCISAVPALAQLNWCVGSYFKGGANLLRPHVAFGIGGRQGGILKPAIFHSITLLCIEIYAGFSVNFSPEHSTGKRKNEPLHLKGSFLHLKTYINLKSTLDKSEFLHPHTRRRIRKTPFSIL
jgi:hypothetical protein